MNEKTSLFDVNLVKKKLISSTLKEVYDALEERGYNPINQLVILLVEILVIFLVIKILEIRF